VVRKRIVRN